MSQITSWFSRKNLVLALLIPVCVVILVSTASDATPSAPVQRTPEQISYQKQHDFASLAKSNVQMILKSPSTAKFNTSPKVTVTNNTYTIESWVDSENSYGAMLRSYWEVKAHYIGTDALEETGKGSNWIIDSFVFDGKRVR